MRDKVYAWLLLFAALAVGIYVFKIAWDPRYDEAFILFVCVPVLLVLMTQLAKRGAFRIPYDIEKDRIPLSQINRGPQRNLPPLVIDLPTITPSLLISHAPTTHLRVVENLNPTVPVSSAVPHLTVVTRED